MSASAIEYRPKTRILLSGSAAKLFGREHIYELSTGSVHEVAKAIDVNHPGFLKYLANAKAMGLEFAIFRNGKNVGEDELKLGGAREIRIVPVICGSKRAGIMQTVVGAVLIVAAAFITAASGGTATPLTSAMAATGWAMAIGGVIQMLSPQAGGLKTSAAPENTPGYAFGNAKNTTASGNPVPLCYGKRRVGGAIISAGIYAEDQV
ncbi:tail assembly protein [Pseudomonas sp. MH9.2]|uniref:tail assembly protein n=1 Tax=Pseudomonas sp. MH9.2 TaxID=3048629 RepID=UPI002AC8F245|nr:tail assembly protein [Pseudomonas sp. MH9.2]MEB0026380.1 tail assembly protein [Pseudomonas sp. MH9.2]WPX67307.1 tail assembly protein [Pseudomonas sp. MH9.2]